MSFSAVRLESAPSVDLAISARHTFNSVALLNASASIPTVSIPAAPELLSVFAVGVVKVFRFVMIVVLGIVLIYFSLVLKMNVLS
jgi:hypothetical protein